MANKQDKKQAIPAHEIAQRLGLDQLQQYVHRYNILPCYALAPRNKPVDPQIKKALTWLGDSIDEDFEQLNRRVDKERKEVEEQERLALEEKKRAVRERKAKEQQDLREKQENEEREKSPSPSS